MSEPVPYDEQQIIAFQQDVDATYVEAHQALDLNNVVWACRMTYDAVAIGYPASRAKHLAELRAALGLQPLFPPAPSRDALGTVLIPFQGFTSTRTSYGAFPMFGPETTGFSNDADLIGYCHDILAAGMTHGEVAVSWAYREPGFLMPVPGRDLSQNLDELCRIIGVMIQAGLTGVLVFMAGDGRSAPQNPDGSYPYNDPVGDTYGYEWVIENAPRIWRAIMAAGLNRYCIAVPGYDGVFPGWDNKPSEGADKMPQRVGHFADVLRPVDPEMLIFLEHGAHWLPLGEGHAIPDFAPGGLMQNYDGVLSEFDSNVHNDAVWQIVARLNPQGYNRPSDQPSGDDPNPPMINAPTSRGARYYCRYEYKTVDWTKGRCSAQDVVNDRAYLQALGAGAVC